MIELFDPEVIQIKPVAWRLGAHGWHYHLDYSWVLQQVEDFLLPGSGILDVGNLYSPMSDHLAKMGFKVDTLDRNPEAKPTILGDFLAVDLPNNLYDAVLWISSIEHQPDLDKMIACYKRSMFILPPGGVFIATFGIGVDSKYLTSIEGWRLSVKDAMRVFDVDTVKGKLEPIWEKYRDNIHHLRNNYVGRFGLWDYQSPEYIAAGVVCVKTERD